MSGNYPEAPKPTWRHNPYAPEKFYATLAFLCNRHVEPQKNKKINIKDQCEMQEFLPKLHDFHLLGRSSLVTFTKNFFNGQHHIYMYIYSLYIYSLFKERLFTTPYSPKLGSAYSPRPVVPNWAINADDSENVAIWAQDFIYFPILQVTMVTRVDSFARRSYVLGRSEPPLFG